MHNREAYKYTPPHNHPASIVRRYLDNLMSLTYEHPILMRNLVYTLGAGSLALLASPLVVPAAGVTAAVAGAAGTTAAVTSGVLQHKVFGFPVDSSRQVYKPGVFEYNGARAEIEAVDKKEMPILHVTANRPYDAGYVEGHILGEAMRENFRQTNYFRPIIGALMAMGLRENLHYVYTTIPQRFREEMAGKVAGYNAWLTQAHPGEALLDEDYYLLLHLMPDTKNYNPFGNSSTAEMITKLFVNMLPQMGCTTIAARLGDYTFFTRVLDWPSYGAAGQYFLQIDRTIAGQKRTIDIGIPVLSGALTVLNEDGVLLEMNVAHGEEVVYPQGMPAVFFNRHCAEKTASLAELNELLAREKPLGAYHLTATDGVRTESFHFYQSDRVRGENAIEALSGDKKSPQLLVVANNGMRFEGSQAKPINYSDSNERKQNVSSLFYHRTFQDKFEVCLKKQEGGNSLSAQELRELQDMFLQLARLPLIKNYESVLCAMYVYRQHQLQQACAVTDNLYAQSKDLEEFRQLRILGPR